MDTSLSIRRLIDSTSLAVLTLVIDSGSGQTSRHPRSETCHVAVVPGPVVDLSAMVEVKERSCLRSEDQRGAGNAPHSRTDLTINQDECCLSRVITGLDVIQTRH
jgi:hypothetical protein